MEKIEQRIQGGEIEEVDNKLSYAKQEWFEAELEGNLRIPQTEIGITPFVAESVLREEPLDLKRFYESQLSPDQLARFFSAMNAVHKAHHIPAASEDQIEDILGRIKKQESREVPPSAVQIVHEERLVRLWNNVKKGTILNMVEVTNYFLAHDKIRISEPIDITP